MKTLSAAEAAALLGVMPATLYAYVSRGLIRSEPGADARCRRYREEDVLALKQRRETRHDAARSVDSMGWDSPVLESAISLIGQGRIFYRGLDATKLATSASVEEVVTLLWRGPGSEPLEWPSESPYLPSLPGHDLAVLAPLERFAVILPLAAARDLAALDLRPQGVHLAATRVLALLTWALCGRWPTQEGGGLVTALASTLAPQVPAALSLVRAALILSADHEVNVSTFAARCAASAGATPYAAVSAGLATIGGTRHGGQQQRVEDLFDAVGTPARAEETLAAWLRGGEAIPGFGHSLYSSGDPRSRTLLDLVARECGNNESAELSQAIAAAAAHLLSERPVLGFSLVTIGRALGLPRGTSLGLYALGRSIGWLAHAMEQYADGRLIRPRTRYVGPVPQPDGVLA